MLKNFSKICLLLTLASCAFFAPSKNKKDKAEIFYSRGTHHLVNKEYTAALKYLLEAYQIDEKDTKILNNLGMAYFFKKRSDLAKKYLKEAIRLDSNNIDALNNLASIYFVEKNFSQAKNLYEKCLENLVYEKQFRVYHNLALIDLEEGNTEEAIKKLKTAYEINTAYCVSSFRLGEIYFQRNEFSQSLEWFNNSQKNECYNNPEPRYKYGLLLSLLNRKNEAASVFRNLIQDFPTSNFKRLAEEKIRELSSPVEDFIQQKNPSNNTKAEHSSLFHSPSF